MSCPINLHRFIIMTKILKLVLVVFPFMLVANCVYCQHGGNGLNLNLADFGAIPNDGKDDSKAFTNALEKCRNYPGSTLNIPPGSYNFQNKKAMEFEYKGINGQYGEDVQGVFFKPKGEYVIALDFDKFKDITINAEGVTFIQEGWYEGVSITNAENVKIKGLTLTHKRPPFTEGVIVNSTAEYFDMKIDIKKYTFLTDDITGRVHYYDTEKEILYTGPANRKELLDKETIRIYSELKPVVGHICILRHSAHIRAGILIKESKNIVLEDVTINSQPGMGIVGHRSEDIVMRNLKVVPAEGTVTSTNTDATHFTSCKGKIIFDGCEFGGQGDDCTNVHNYYWSLFEESGKDIRISVEGADLHALSLDFPDICDTLVLVSKYDLEPKEYYIVKNVKTSIEKWTVVLTLDKEIVYDLDEYYLTNITRRPSVEIVNNVVNSHLARAYLIKTGNVHIHGNFIKGSSGTAIQLGAESGWRESGPVENILIENNIITDCGFGRGRMRGTAISVEVNGIINPLSALNSNITIRDNIINALGEVAIYVSYTDGVYISDNKITGSIYAVSIENSYSVIVGNNGSLPVLMND
jgi:hypothetical protein